MNPSISNSTRDDRSKRDQVERAKLTKARNNILRGSAVGRLLLVLERCWLLNNKETDMNSRRFSRLLDELRYACKLADEAAVPNGWVQDDMGSFLLAFQLSSGDIVFATSDQGLGAEPFSRKPIPSDQADVLARAIAQGRS